MSEKTEIEHLKERLKQLEAYISISSSVIGSTSVANSGQFSILKKMLSISSSHNIPHEPKSTWILDSVAIDHMTPIASLFASDSPCEINKKVQTADGTLLTVAGIGTVNLAPIGKLERVLHVPKLFISLVSVQKITSLIPYNIEFNGINAFLYDRDMGVEDWTS